MSNFYETILSSTHLPVFKDKEEVYQSLREKHLHVLWFEQHYLQSLRTSQGMSIEVISPGIWNGEAGPDFLKAHLVIGDKEYRGDIEIHMRDEQWEQHQHHGDARYDQVILHISLWKGKSCKPLNTTKSTIPFQCYLEDSFSIPIEKIPQIIDLELYPFAHFVGTGRCAEAIFSKNSEQETKQFFLSAAQWRLKQKYSRLVESSQNGKSTLLVGMAETLGYKHNAAAFLKLFFELQKRAHLSFEELLAYSLKRCGFFTDHYTTLWGDSPYYKNLWEISRSFSVDTQIELKLNQIRPLNHPVRRLVLLVYLLKSERLTSLDKSMKALWEAERKQLGTLKSAQQLYQKMLKLFPEVELAYWVSHYTFESKTSLSPLSLMGNDLRTKIILNVICPILFHQQIDTDQQQAFKIFYEALPSVTSRKKEYLAQRFFGDSLNKNLLKKGAVEQGAFQLHQDFCLRYEASCLGCPFVEHYQNSRCKISRP